METIRQKKVARLLQRELSTILHSKLSASGVLVTVSDTRVSSDFSICRVYISCFPDTRTSGVFEEINRIQVPIRHELARRLRHEMRTVPELHFFEDEIPKEAARLDTIFQNIHKNSAVNPPLEENDL